MIFEAIYFLSILSRTLAVATFNEYIQSASFDEVPEIQSSISLCDSCIMKHGQTLSIPDSEIDGDFA